MNLSPGRRLGPYEIVAPLGAGGMGEVYRARDARLHRDVAIKILPAEFANDTERRARFEREAQAAARLEHPNVASVYDLGVDDGIPFIVSELVDGVSLRTYLSHHAPSAALVRAVGAQTAEALAAAHERGIVHRDIKPDNILVCADDAIKVVDFGVAKIQDAASGSTVTVTNDATAPGVIVGTASYMSPEQIRGAPVDHRSDLFSLGAVLYELATGHRPFGGSTAAETMAAVLRDEPREASELAALPAALTAIIMRCLDKRPAHRFQSARDLAFALHTLPRSTAEQASVALSAPRRSSRLWHGTALGVAAAVALIAAAWTFAGGGATPPAGPREVRQLTFESGVEAFPSLSADGSLIVYAATVSGNRDVYLKDVVAREALNLTADSKADDSQPALSRDGQQVAFRSERDGGGIFVMSRTGGTPRRITRSGFNPAWSPDGRFIATADESVDWRPDSRTSSERYISVHDVTNGGSRVLKTHDAVQPSWSPGGHRIAYWGLGSNRSQRDLWTVALDGSAPVRVTDDPALDWDPSWSPDGRWLYFSSERGGSMNMWRIAIDETTGVTNGVPEPVVLPASWAAHARIGPRGEIVFASFHRSSNIDRVPFDPVRGRFTGPPLPLTTGSNMFTAAQASRDGRRLTFSAQNGIGRNIFVSDIDGTNIRAATSGPYRETGVYWHPDSNRIAFYSARSGTYQLWSVHQDGSGLQQLTDIRSYGLGRAIWSSSGDRFATVEIVTGKAFLIDLRKGTPAKTSDELPVLLDGSTFSPYQWSADDSRLLGESSRGAVVVLSLRDRTYRELSARGSGGPRWLPNGQRVIYSIGHEFFIVDERSGKVESIGRADEPAALPVVSWSLDWDGRWLYRTRMLVQSDLWLMVAPQ